MNKEEIENIEKIKKMLNFTTEGTSLRINNEVSKLLLKYINYLEQKESILDKVTDKLKEDIKEFDKLRKSHEMYSPSEERLSSKYFYAQEILNIIEGEKK